MLSLKNLKKSLIVALSVLLVTGALGELTRRVVFAQTPSMHVAQISVGWNFQGASRLPFAYVFIQDESGKPVDGALVTGNWSGCNTLNGASATTQLTLNSDGTPRGDGVATIYGKKVSYQSCGTCSFIFTVTNVI